VSTPSSARCYVQLSPDQLEPDHELPDQLEPDQELPDHELPDQLEPDHELPDHELPDQLEPDHELPDHELPDQELPDQLEPFQVPPDQLDPFASAAASDLVLIDRPKMSCSPVRVTPLAVMWSVPRAASMVPVPWALAKFWV